MPQTETSELFKFISKSQRDLVTHLLKKSGFDALQIQAYIKQEWGGKTVYDIPRTAYKGLVKRLEAGEISPAHITDPDDIPL